MPSSLRVGGSRRPPLSGSGPPKAARLALAVVPPWSTTQSSSPSAARNSCQSCSLIADLRCIRYPVRAVRRPPRGPAVTLWPRSCQRRARSGPQDPVNRYITSDISADSGREAVTGACAGYRPALLGGRLGPRKVPRVQHRAPAPPRTASTARQTIMSTTPATKMPMPITSGGPTPNHACPLYEFSGSDMSRCRQTSSQASNAAPTTGPMAMSTRLRRLMVRCRR